MQHKQKIAARKEQLYQLTLENIKLYKTAHCSTNTVTEERMNDLKRMFMYAKVPYGGDGKCYMFCKG